MRISGFLTVLAWTFIATPVFSQVQIGGGVCSPATLSGTYSLTLSGRDVSPAVAFVKVSQGVGTAAFDGAGKVTLTFANNTLAAAGTAQTWSGSYTMQGSCTGTVSITSGNAAAFSLVTYNSGKAFLITGQDGTYALTGSGGLLPTTAACSATQLSGTYAIAATGFFLTAGAVSGVNDVSGVLQLDGKSAITGTIYLAGAATNSTLNLTGQFALTQGCAGTGTVTDSSGKTYALQFLETGGGGGFLLSGANAGILFIGSGRTI